MTRSRRCHACCHGDSRAHATVGLLREGNQAGGWGERVLGIQAGRKLILIFSKQLKKATCQNQHKFILNYSTTPVSSIFQKYRHIEISIRSSVLSETKFRANRINHSMQNASNSHIDRFEFRPHRRVLNYFAIVSTKSETALTNILSFVCNPICFTISRYSSFLFPLYL